MAILRSFNPPVYTQELNRLKKERDDELRKIYEETIDESSNIDLIAFGNRVLAFADKTNTDYYAVVKSICDNYYKHLNSNSFVIACIVEKFKDYDNQVYKVIEELALLAENKKIDFEEAANSLSERFNIPFKEIMTIYFGVAAKHMKF